MSVESNFDPHRSSGPLSIPGLSHRIPFSVVSSTPPFSSLGYEFLEQQQQQHQQHPQQQQQHNSPGKYYYLKAHQNGDGNRRWSRDEEPDPELEYEEDTPRFGVFDRFMSEQQQQQQQQQQHQQLQEKVTEVTSKPPSSSRPWSRSKRRKPPANGPLLLNCDGHVDEDATDHQTDEDLDRKYSLSSDCSLTSDLSSPCSSDAAWSPVEPLDARQLEEKFVKLGLVTMPSAIGQGGVADRNEEDDDDDDEDEKEEEDEDEEEEMVRGPMIRSISLKTGKTPPGTPSRKKFVRFADALGLDLTLVKTITQDDLPTVPKSAFSDLQLEVKRGQQQPSTTTSTTTTTTSSKKQQLMSAMELIAAGGQLPSWLSSAGYSRPTSSLSLITEFSQPFTSVNFLDRVRSSKVCLEYCTISSGAGHLGVTCVSRVLNVSFEKKVTIRYTLDAWRSSTDALASYIPGSSDGWSDKFTGTFSLRSSTKFMRPGQRVFFALRYTANEEEYWDNNMGLNYSLICRAY